MAPVTDQRSFTDQGFTSIKEYSFMNAFVDIGLIPRLEDNKSCL